MDVSLIETQPVAGGLDQKRGRGRPKGTRPKKKEAGPRVHVSLPESLTTRLLEIQRYTHANTVTEVLKAALTLYAAAVEEHKNGGNLYFKRKGEDGERQLALFI
jgi:hypothetical protein